MEFPKNRKIVRISKRLPVFHKAVFTSYFAFIVVLIHSNAVAQLQKLYFVSKIVQPTVRKKNIFSIEKEWMLLQIYYIKTIKMPICKSLGVLC